MYKPAANIIYIYKDKIISDISLHHTNARLHLEDDRKAYEDRHNASQHAYVPAYRVYNNGLGNAYRLVCYPQKDKQTNVYEHKLAILHKPDIKNHVFRFFCNTNAPYVLPYAFHELYACLIVLSYRFSGTISYQNYSQLIKEIDRKRHQRQCKGIGSGSNYGSYNQNDHHSMLPVTAHKICTQQP